ncbi:MAG: SMP-30/gluconolactonase/LRE family protein [Planctomycetes bacterium]|nr:SMP-30/gluconolactonase/LRE family protein [Planctomycetota bacterium]
MRRSTFSTPAALCVAVLCFVTASGVLRAQLPAKPVLTLDAARRIAAAAHAAADVAHATVVIAVVDDGGHLLLLERRDDTQVASSAVAEAKARTAAIFRRPTREFEQQIAAGRLATLVLTGAAPLQGGVPLVVAGHVVGAIGVSGNSPAQDEQIALAGAAVAQSLGQPHAIVPEPVATTIVRMDPRLDAILPFDAQLERIATGFVFTEGPVWVGDALLCSDPNENRIWRWSATEGVSLFRDRSGYQGADIRSYQQPGSNGLALDPRGNLIVCEHGNRCISQLAADGTRRVLVDRHQGRRLNSPNDVVVAHDGSIYFTDPPFGLPATFDDARKELPFSGVFRWQGGSLSLESDALQGPNGIALSPDESVLYVGNWDVQHKVVLAFARSTDGSLGPGRTFLDLTQVAGDTAIDGLEVDAKGNVYVCGPGGIWIVGADGAVLGRVADRPEEPHNLAFGEHGHTLFIAAQTGLYRLRLAAADERAAAPIR